MQDVLHLRQFNFRRKTVALLVPLTMIHLEMQENIGNRFIHIQIRIFYSFSKFKFQLCSAFRIISKCRFPKKFIFIRSYIVQIAILRFRKIYCRKIISNSYKGFRKCKDNLISLFTCSRPILKFHTKAHSELFQIQRRIRASI